MPTPINVVHRMLKLGEVKNGDMLFDLGSGDGRIVITAVQEYGAKAVGVELDSDLAERANARIKELSIGDRASVLHADLMEVDLHTASVVTLYLLSSSNMQLRPNWKRTSSRAHGSSPTTFKSWAGLRLKPKPSRQMLANHKIFVYEVGKP